MVGISSRSTRFATLLLIFFASHAFADAPVTSYYCGPGKNKDGAGCTCPKKHNAARDPGDEGTPICAISPKGRKLPKRTQDITVPVTGTKIVVNGVEISGRPQMADIEALFGKADRLWEKPNSVNRIHTWDKLGFVVYEPTRAPGRAGSLAFPFTSMKTDFDPSKTFAGKITVDGFAMKAGTKFDAVKARPGTTQPYSETSLIYAKGDFNVFVPGPNGTVDLVELGLWKNAPPPAAKNADAAPVDGTTGDAAPKRPTTVPKRTEDIKVTVDGTRIVVNGVDLSANPRLVDIEALYGKADRVWDTKGGLNRIHTWDKLGVLVYEPTGNPGRAISMTLPFTPVGPAYDPSTMFGGAISVDGFSLKAATMFKDAKARPGVTQPYGDTSLVFEKGGFNVFVPGPKGTVDLVEISFWKKPPSADAKTADSAPANTSGIAAADVRVSLMSDGNVTLMGKDIGGKPMLADIKSILGEPNRVWEKKGAANKIHVWDNLGVIAYEPADNAGRVKSLTLLFKPMKTDFSPTSMFAGRVEIDRKGFYKFNTIATVKQRSGATQPYGQDTVVFDLGDVHLMAKAPAPTVETLELVDVSFWQKK